MNASRIFAAAALGMATLLGGCYGGYSSWPPVGGNTAPNDINAGSAPVIMATALRWATTKFPPVPNAEIGEFYDVPFAINLPAGSDDDTHDNVVRWIGKNAHPLTRQTEDLPIYHIKRVDVRGPIAEVDIVHPIIRLTPGPDGQPVYQGVTAILRGGTHPWKVENYRTFALGQMEVPAKTYQPRSVQDQRPRPAPAVEPAQPATKPPDMPPAEPSPPPAPGEVKRIDPPQQPAPTTEPGRMEPVEPKKPESGR